MEELFSLILVLSIIGISANNSHSAKYWSKTYGGSDFDLATSIQQTTDGGYIVAGNTRSFGAALMDIWVLKLDNSGNITWQKIYSENRGNNVSSIQQTTDGGYIVGGKIYSYGVDSFDSWVLKLDSGGNVLWQRTYGGSKEDSASSIQQTTDGGYIVAGGTDSFGAGEHDFWVLKLDSSGNISWQKTYGGSSGEYAHSILQTSDGGYMAGGRIHESPGSDHYNILILKLDSSGNLSWQKRYGRSNYDGVSSIQQTTDGGYIMAGYTSSLGSSMDEIWVLKLDSSGNVIWQKTYGGSFIDAASSIQQTTDGGYIVAGDTDSFGNISCIFFNIWVLKLNSSGNILWQKTYNGGSDWEAAASIQQTQDGGYIVAGKTTIEFNTRCSDIWILKIDSNGGIHDCDEIYIDSSNASISNTSVSGVDTNLTAQSSAATVTDTDALVKESAAEIRTICETDVTTICPSEAIYGEDSEEAELLRYIRDNTLSQTPAGKELNRLYYQWSPAIVKMMENDEEFKKDMKGMIDGVLTLISEEAE